MLCIIKSCYILFNILFNLTFFQKNIFVKTYFLNMILLKKKLCLSHVLCIVFRRCVFYGDKIYIHNRDNIK